MVFGARINRVNVNRLFHIYGKFSVSSNVEVKPYEWTSFQWFNDLMFIFRKFWGICSQEIKLFVRFSLKGTSWNQLNVGILILVLNLSLEIMQSLNDFSWHIKFKLQTLLCNLLKFKNDFLTIDRSAWISIFSVNLT